MSVNGRSVLVTAIVVLGWATGFGCAPSPEERSETNQQEINGVSCSQAVLNASRSYRPNGFIDARVAVGGPMAFVLPAEIPVTAGAPGNHNAILSFGNGSSTIECTYRGNGVPSHDDGDDEGDDDGDGDGEDSAHGGTAYVFKECEGRNDRALAPGDAMTADTFALHVSNGDRRFGTTSVKLVIDETRPCDPVTRGEAAFHDRVLAGLGGNGRSCATCHMDSNHFQLSPANAEFRFQQMVKSGIDDPLFRPIDADDFDTNGDSASDYSNLRQNGLIRIRMTLPANIKLVDPASCRTAGVPAPCQTATIYSVSPATTTDVWRAVPSVLNVSVSGPDSQVPAWPRGPNPQGGYQLDGRIDTLQNQALGAFLNHAKVATPPALGMLDDLAAYQSTLVADAEPQLDALEAAGKAVFTRACTQCHGGPGLGTPTTQTPPLVRYHDISTSCPPPVDPAGRFKFAPCAPGIARNARTYEISFADGFKLRRTTTDPGRALLSGFVFSAGPPLAGATCAHPPCGLPALDDWQKLDIAPLHGISKTAPYFHNNRAATLEDVVIHYEEFFKLVIARAPGLPPVLTTDGIHIDRPNKPEERAALVAYLTKL